MRKHHSRTETEKCCSWCGKWKSFTEFNKALSGMPRATCKECWPHRYQGGYARKSKHGSGTISRKGYRVIYRNGKAVYEHRYVWEQYNGPIPEGMEVHHKNGEKTDNRIENFELLSTAEHAKEHNNMRERDAKGRFTS